MATYFFHIRGDEGLAEDTEGAEFPDLAAAICYAEDSVRELLADAIVSRVTVDGRVMEVTGEDGAVVATIAYRDILAKTAS